MCLLIGVSDKSLYIETPITHHYSSLLAGEYEYWTLLSVWYYPLYKIIPTNRKVIIMFTLPKPLSEIDKSFFTGHYRTEFFEWLLVELDGRDKDVVIGELEDATWNEARAFERCDVKSPSRAYLLRLMNALDSKLKRALACDREVTIDMSVGNMLTTLEIFGYGVHNEKRWVKFLDIYTHYTKLGELILKIGTLDEEGVTDSVILKDIKKLKLRRVLKKYSLSNDEIDALGLTLSTEFMPARVRDAVVAAHVVKSYIDENLSDEYKDCQVYIENNGIGLGVVLRGVCGDTPIETIDDVLRLTK